MDTSRLQQIIARVTDFLDSMMHARTSAKQDAHLAQPLLEELAHQAEPVLVELRAANAGLAAAQALSSLPHASGQSLVTQSARTISQPTTQAARPASKLPVGQAGLSPASPLIWSSSRTLLLLPTDPEVRRWPLSPSDFARRIESALQARNPEAASPFKGRCVELARRTAKGDFVVQFFEQAWSAVKTLTRLTVPSLGEWTISLKDTGRNDISVVFRGIPTSISLADLQTDFIQSNANRFQGFDAHSLKLDLIRADRLKRRCRQGPNMGKWVDSSAVRFTFFRPLGEAILEAGGAVLNYAVHAATPYTPTQRHCARCGILGHLAAYCRNVARCRHCGTQGSHETRECPHMAKIQRPSTATPSQSQPHSRMEGATDAPLHSS